MTTTAFTVGMALAGCVAGGIAGWFLGRLVKGQPLRVLWISIASIAGGVYLAWVGVTSGDPKLAPSALGAAFGIMTAIKYSAGMIPGVEKPPAKPVAAEDPPEGAER